MPIMIRVDDFPYTKPDEWNSGKHSIEKFNLFNDCFEKKYLLGIIPWTSKKANVAPPLDKVVPGLHGFWHNENSLNEWNLYPYNDICAYLTSGNEIVEAMGFGRPFVYMPPHNEIDLATIHACRKVGFKAITTGPASAEADRQIQAITNLGLKQIDSRPPAYGRSDELIARGNIKEVLEMSRSSVVTLGLHWTWETNIGLSSLKEMLDMIKDDIVDFEI